MSILPRPKQKVKRTTTLKRKKKEQKQFHTKKKTSLLDQAYKQDSTLDIQET